MGDSLNKVTLRQMQIFLVAAENGSFLQTAKVLELTPPAVSMQMSRLGEGMGAPLFEKQGRKVVLTEAGANLVPYAEKIIQTLREARENIEVQSGVKRATVKVAMVTTSRNFGPHLAARFQASHPEIRLDVSIANRRSVIDKLEHNQIDLALMGRTPRKVEVEAEAFAEHPYVVIASPEHRLAGEAGISPEQLVGESILGRESGSGTRMVLDYFFRDNNLPMPLINEMDSNENIKQAVMANMGIAFISKHTIHLELQSRRLVELKVRGTPQMRTWYVLHKAGRELGPAALKFKKFVKSQGPQFMAEFFAESAG